MPSAPSPTSWPKTAFPIGPTLVGAFCAAPVAVLPELAFNLYASSHGLIPKNATLAQVPIRVILLSQLMSYIPLIAYLLVLVPRLAQRSLPELGVRTPRAWEILIGLAGTFVMFTIVASTSTILTSLTHQHAVEPAVQLLRSLRTPGQTLAFIAIAVLFAPLVEEFAFRVFLFNAISRHTSTIVGAILSGLAFGFVHGTDVTVAVPLSCGGIVLAWIYMRSGCYWSNVITHACFNAVSVIAVLIFHATD